MRNRMNRISANRTPLIEALEGRRLLAGQAVEAAAIQEGVLQVTGTREADLITVGMNYSDSSSTKVDVTLNGTVVGSYPLSAISSGVVEIHGGRGDDSIRFDESMGLVPLRMIAHGEAGNDTLVGGFLDDELHGGAGQDVLFGNDGNDYLYGDNGNDMLACGFGNDHADGGKKSDTIYGESGADTFASSDKAEEILDLAAEDVYVPPTKGRK